MGNNLYSVEEIPPILKVPQVAQFLSIGKNQVYDLIRAGRLEAIRVGRKIIIPRHCLLAFIGL